MPRRTTTFFAKPSRHLVRLGKGQKRFDLGKLEMPELEAIEKIARRKIMYTAAKIIALRARKIVPVSRKKYKGKLSKTIRYRAYSNGLKSKAYSRSPHAHLVHDGTASHKIRDHSKETARAGWRYYHGSTRRAVNHPGARAQPFFEEAREQTRGEVEKAMREGMEAAAAAVAAGEGA